MYAPRNVASLLVVTMATLAAAGCGARPADDITEVTSALTAADVMGLETPSGWSTTTAGARLSQSTVHDQGSFSLQVDPSSSNGFTPIASIPLSKPAAVGPSLAFDVMLPTAQANPNWQGTAQMYLNCPSRGIYSAFLAQVELTGRPLGVWTTVNFPIPSATVGALLNGGYTDLTITLVLNVAVPALGPHFVDNLRFLPAAGGSGCGGMPDGTTCDDANSCTTGETCRSGVCGGGVAKPNGTACDDGDACTSGESCSAGACGGGTRQATCTINAAIDYQMASHFPGTDAPPGFCKLPPDVPPFTFTPLAVNIPADCTINGVSGCQVLQIVPFPKVIRACAPQPCAEGAVSACALSCGGTGIRHCHQSNWGACTAFERCNSIDDDCDGVADNGSVCQAPLSLIDPANAPGWDTTLDACASTATGSSIAQYAWDVTLPSGVVHVPPTTSCTTPFVFPSEDTFPVSLTVTTTSGLKTSKTGSIRIKNHFIVSMGDSIASGEGDPQVEAQNTADNKAVWVDRRCHLSSVAWHAKAVDMLERNDPHTSATFHSVACSGASVGKGVLGPYEGIETDGTVEAAQLDRVHVMTQNKDRKIDALLLQVGANDVHFGDEVSFCAVPSFTKPSDATLAVLVLFAGFPVEVAATISSLPDGDLFTCANDVNLAAINSFIGTLRDSTYPNLDQQIRSKVGLARPQGIYIAEYPDPTHGDNGEACDMVLEGAINDGVVPLIPFASIGPLVVLADPVSGATNAGILTTFVNVVPDGHISANESAWMHDHFVVPLNQMIATTATQRGWTFIGGVNDPDNFGKHGFCSSPTTRRFRHYAESKTVEGTKDGTLHPNPGGQSTYAQLLFNRLRVDLP